MIPDSTDPTATSTVTPDLYMIGNAHLDPVWLWRWPEGCAEAIGTCWAAIDRLDEHPDFVFTRGEAQVYRWIRELEPALFERIRSYVRAGRWVVTNGWWVQPDCNLPHGEAFIRQALYGQAELRDALGVRVHTGYNVDSFGHAATLPMLLRHTGYDQYVFMRPMAHEKTLTAALFDWVSPDGSSVRSYRIPVAYGSFGPLEEAIASVTRLRDREGTPMMCFYGVGNHGGGPTRASLEHIDAARAAGQPLRFSDPDRYFRDTARLTLPRVQDELQFHAVGCYAAVSDLKALNRRAEARLADAESAATLACTRAGAAYPRAELTRLWETLLFNQFHDILGGSSVQSATQDALEALGGVIQQADQLTNTALRRLATTVAPAPAPRDATFLVVNLTGTPFDGLVTHEPWLDWDDRSPRALIDEDSQPVAFADVPAEAHMNGLRRLLFRLQVPAFGHRTLRFTPADVIAAPHAPQVDPWVTRTARWTLELDPHSGAIARLYDHAGGREVFAGPAHLAQLIDDPSDTWSHGLDRYPTHGAPLHCTGVDVLEDTPLRRVVRVTAEADGVRVTSEYRVPTAADLPIEIGVTLHLSAEQRLLRLSYPTALQAPTMRFEVPYGHLARPADGREVPGQRWVSATDAQGYGVAIANDAKYSYAAEGASVHFTAARTPAYAHHDPRVLGDPRPTTFIDQGAQHFELRLLAGPQVNPQRAFTLAEQLLRPPRTTPHVARGGRGAARGQWLSVEAPGAVVSWLKLAERSDDPVLRVLNLQDTQGALTDPGGTAHPLRPLGIHSFALRGDRARPVNGLEEDLDA